MVRELAKTAAKRRQIGRLVQDAVAAVQTAAAATNNRSEEAKKKCIRSSRSTTPKPAHGTAHIRLKRRPL